MRRKNGIVVLTIIMSIALVTYLGVFFFYYPGLSADWESYKTWLYFLPVLVALLIIIFLMVYLGLFNSLSKTNAKLRDEMKIKTDLLNALEKNDEIVYKDLPIGIIVYTDNSIISNANDFAKTLFQNSLIGRSISYVSSSLNDLLKNKKTGVVIDVYGRKLSVINNFSVKSIYLFDVTERESILDKDRSTAPAVIIASLDNIEDSLTPLGLQKRSEILGLYYSSIEKWSNKYNLFSMAGRNEKQIFIATQSNLDLIIQDNFSILDDIDSISHEQEVSVSLSLGVGYNNSDYNILGHYAQKALEDAGNRGGDQAVIYDGDNEKAFGGNTQFSERKTRKQAKVYSDAIIQEMKNASSIIIMPHKDTDADALGSALGLCELAKSINTPAKVLIDPEHVDGTVNKIIESSNFEYIKLNQSLITTDEVTDFFQGRKLLIIVDHHDESQMVNKNICKMASSIIVIDHHRLTSALSISSKITYIDHNASSSVELVSELVSLSSEPVKIPPYIATVMLIGMMIDTNNFSLHMGDRTFIAAAFLMDNGADASSAKQYLRESISEQSERIDLLKSAEIIYGQYAIVRDDDKKIVQKETLAKNANALLDTENIIASFAIGRIDKDVVGVSGRSNGNFNIHTLMERMGGGGHFTEGAAQIKNKSVIEVEESLKTNLDTCIKGEGNTMKVILIEDVKHQGKKGDTIDVTPGFGSYLLQKKQAIEANVSNLAVLEEQKAAQERHIQEETDVANKLKEILKGIKIKVEVKSGSNGKLFGSVSTQDIVVSLEKQENISLDKRKITLPPEKITSLGTYPIEVKLYKNISASFNIEVVEKQEA